MPWIGAGVYEIRIHARGAYRLFYVVIFDEAIYVLHSFQKKTKKQPNVTSRSVSSVTKQPRRARVEKIARGSDNVFKDVGFEAEEAANLKIRADLLIDLREHIRTHGWTQAQAAAFFGETQPRISNLLKGEISLFSTDKLVNMLARAGIRVRLGTEQRQLRNGLCSHDIPRVNV
jgi:predicted XRE-type DNA-binding protein